MGMRTVELTVIVGTAVDEGPFHRLEGDRSHLGAPGQDAYDSAHGRSFREPLVEPLRTWDSRSGLSTQSMRSPLVDETDLSGALRLVEDPVPGCFQSP